MKILHTVESYLPMQHGMQEVVKQLSEKLTKYGHDVTIATSFCEERNFDILNNVKIVQFRISGNAVKGYNATDDEIDRYKNFIKNSEFDVIVNFAAQQWATDLTLDLLENIDSVKILVPTGFSFLHKNRYCEYYEKMKTWLKLYDMNVFLSNNYQDINFAKDAGVKDTILIPNGADENEFENVDYSDICSKYDIKNDNFLILLVGSHTGIKGHKEAIRIFKKANIKNATLVIIGKKVSEKCTKNCKNQSKLIKYNPFHFIKNKKLLLLNIERHETVKLFKRADLFLFPSNLECSPIVLFEAMASKTPFLVSDCGNSKEIISWSKSGVMLPTSKKEKGFVKVDIKKSAKILEDIVKNGEKRKELSENGYNSWKENFTWEKIARNYENLYLTLLKNKKR